MARRVDQRCSFCGKERNQVDRLVAGPGVFICDECIALCNEIINEPPPEQPMGDQNASWARSTSSSKPFWRRLFRTGVVAPA